MQIIIGVMLTAFVLSVIVGGVGAWWESRAANEWQRQTGEFYANAGAYGFGLAFVLAVIALFYQLIH
jgi:hypothetical protein